MRFIILLACLLAPLATPSPSFAQLFCFPSDRTHPECPRMNPDNGHYYALSAYYAPGTQFASWEGSRVSAETLEFMGMRGYLATITSESENEFITQSVNGDGGRFWFGASDRDVEGEWRWMAGPEAGELFWLGGPDGVAFGYSNWNADEPNDLFGEDFAQLGWHPDAWNDFLDTPPGGLSQGYVVEFSPVPEPSSYALAMIGLLGGGSVARLRKRH